MARRTKKRLYSGTRINNKHNRNQQSNKRKVTQTGKRKVMTGGKEKNPYLPKEQKTTKMEYNPLFKKFEALNNSSSTNNSEFDFLKTISPEVHKGLVLNTQARAEKEYMDAKGAHQNAKQKSMESLASLYGYGGSKSNIYGEQSRIRNPEKFYESINNLNFKPAPYPNIKTNTEITKSNAPQNPNLNILRKISTVITKIKNKPLNSSNSVKASNLQTIRAKLMRGSPLTGNNKDLINSFNNYEEL
jgi:hypothetical protein